MTAIGTLSEAQQAASFLTTGRWGYPVIDTEALAAGWSVLGEGSWRYAFLSPSGVVYKVDKDGCSNVKEYERFCTLGNDDSRGFRFAVCHLWAECSNVLAMEFVQDDGSDVGDSYQRMNSYMGFLGYTDCMHYKRKENWHGVKGVAIITDYAYGFGEN